MSMDKLTAGPGPRLVEEENQLSDVSVETREHGQGVQEVRDMLEGCDAHAIRLEHVIQGRRLGLVRRLESARRFHVEAESSEAVVDISGAVDGESGEVAEQTSTPLTPTVAPSTLEESNASTMAMSPLDPEETTPGLTPVLTTPAMELDAGENGEEAKQVEAVASLAAEDVSDKVCDEVNASSHTLSTSESGAGDSEVSNTAGDDSLFDSPALEVLDWSLSEPGPLASSSSSVDPSPPPPSLLARLGMAPVDPPDAGPVAPPGPPQTGGPMRGGRGRGRGVGRGRARGGRGGNPQGHRGAWRGRGL